MFNPVILVVIDIISQILFYYLVKLFYLSIGLKIKGYKKLVVHSEFYNEYYKESRSKGHTFIYYKLI